jgi:hypothetical protein
MCGTIQNESGRKKMPTKVRSLMFSPIRVDARISVTPVAFRSYQELINMGPSLYRDARQ